MDGGREGGRDIGERGCQKRRETNRGIGSESRKGRVDRCSERGR